MGTLDGLVDEDDDDLLDVRDVEPGDGARALAGRVRDACANLSSAVARCCHGSNPDFGDGYQAAVNRFERHIRALALTPLLPAPEKGSDE